MKKIFHKADTRGYFDHGWLKTYHSFSFGSWVEPTRMNFGMLRVLNDDSVAAGHGFGRHPHDNMEIVSIPLKGALAHKDSQAHEEAIKPNEIQVMSAGTGISHSEYNHSKEQAVKFLQIWILPDKRGHEPRYDQKMFGPADRLNQFHTVVTPRKENGLWINQHAWFSLADLDADKMIEYNWHDSKNGVYFFVLEGSIKIADEKLGRRDAVGIWEAETIEVSAKEKAELLAVEVPMN